MNPVAQARELYGAGRLREAGAILSDHLRRNPTDADAMQLLGVIQFQSGFQREGLKLAERATSLMPSNPEAWNNLGLMHHMLGRADAALDAFTRATHTGPRYADAWKNRGFLLQTLGRHAEALDSLARAGDSVDSRFFVGNSLAALGRQLEAIASFDRVVGVDPENGAAWLNRGNSLLALGRAPEAVESLKEAIKFLGKDPLAYCCLGLAVHQQGRADEALGLIEQALRWDPSLEQAIEAKAMIVAELEELDRMAEDLSGSDSSEPRSEIAINLQGQGKWRLGLDTLKNSKISGEQFLHALLMPAIFESSAMAEDAFQHLSTEVARLRGSPPHLDDPLREVGVTSFHLPYFGLSDRKVQEDIAGLYREAAPILRFEASHSAKPGRTRVGVISANLYEHTISRVFGGLIERLDKERFEVIYLQIGKSDEVTARIAKSADRHLILTESLPEAQEAIAREELDVIFYPEIGINPLTYYLAFSRLAPAQCVTWGHPLTTGSPVIDYYLSSRHLERSDGQEEYTEKVARSEHLGTFYQRPQNPPEWQRSDYGLPDNRRLYGCMQMAYKFHPEFDRALAAIAARDERALLVLVEPQHPLYRDILSERWKRLYPKLSDQVVFVPPMPLPNFLRLVQLCDSLLAPIQFGAGRSSFDSLGVGAPVVTYEGPFLKTRITSASYRQMGMTDLIATSEEEYVDLALRLANDREWQAGIRQLVSSRSGPLFENQAAVDEFNAFLASLPS